MNDAVTMTREAPAAHRSATALAIEAMLADAYDCKNGIAYSPLRRGDVNLGIVSATVLNLAAQMLTLRRQIAVQETEFEHEPDQGARESISYIIHQKSAELDVIVATFKFALGNELGWKGPDIVLRSTAEGVVGAYTAEEMSAHSFAMNRMHCGAKCNVESEGGGQPRTCACADINSRMTAGHGH